MIKSILEQDLYCFSVSYFFSRKFPDGIGELTFFDRNNTKYTKEFVEELKRNLYSISSMKLTEEEFNWVTRKIKYIPEPYWEWLHQWKFDPGKVSISLEENGQLSIVVVDKLYRLTLYEIPILATISELIHKQDKIIMSDVLERLDKKIELSNREQLWFMEFGLRRRAGYNVQDEVVRRIKTNAMYCTGTSNVHLAMKYDMIPQGTMNHALISFHLAQYGYRQGQYIMMENWEDVYDSQLGCALTDTITSKAFFDQLSRKHAFLFPSFRQDSGDEYKFVCLMINRLKELGVDPKDKTIVFSNALDMEKFKDISDYCKGRIKKAIAGIGTNLTCDIPEVRQANIVMKLTRCRMNENKPWIPCIKISDDFGKHMGDKEELEVAYKTLGIDINK